MRHVNRAFKTSLKNHYPLTENRNNFGETKLFTHNFFLKIKFAM